MKKIAKNFINHHGKSDGGHRKPTDLATVVVVGRRDFSFFPSRTAFPVGRYITTEETRLRNTTTRSQNHLHLIPLHSTLHEGSPLSPLQSLTHHPNRKAPTLSEFSVHENLPNGGHICFLSAEGKLMEIRDFFTENSLMEEFNERSKKFMNPISFLKY